ncbi:MAG: methyl-accepting chemotaxis protein [Desulfatibacillum sp.]|nr:methyl-accepting chemotaxis protein [Desulfatibacillum sp.]
MLLSKIRSSSIGGRITFLTFMGLLLMGTIAGMNGVLNLKKTTATRVERMSHVITLNVVNSMKLEEGFMNNPDPAILEQLDQLQEKVRAATKGIEDRASGNGGNPLWVDIVNTVKGTWQAVQGGDTGPDIQELGAAIGVSLDKHADLFQKAAANTQSIAETQKKMADILAEARKTLEGFVADIDRTEVALMIKKGKTLDASQVALRSEAKDLQRTAELAMAHVQTLVYVGNVDGYVDSREATLEAFSLYLNNTITALDALKEPKFATLTDTYRKAGNEFLALEKAILEKCKIKRDLGAALEGTRKEVRDASDKITQHTEKSIYMSESIQHAVGYTVVVLGLITMTLLGYGINRSIVRPVRLVVEGLKNISEGEGDLTVRLSVRDESEMGELARFFNLFVAKQHTMIHKIMEAAHSLGAFTADVTTTASQLAASAAEETTSVAEVTTTTEEVKQTVALSSEKAEMVAQESDAMSLVSKAGMDVTHRASQGMGNIMEEMEYIAQSIVKLSEQTQSIEEIINAVSELSNQSDLLSVNASIEAAKAGEFGKGFAVVAQEVKNLARQSRESANQVRRILQEIHRATDEAVMAAERGAKAVEVGRTLSVESGKAIEELTNSIEQSVRSAAQIASSCRQQLAGMEQLDMAMRSISVSSGQNLDSSKRLEDLTKGLRDLGNSLESQTRRFKL